MIFSCIAAGLAANPACYYRFESLTDATIDSAGGFNLTIPASATGVWDRYCPGTGKLTADRYYRFRAAPNHCNSYVVLDERLRLLDCSTGGKLPSSMSVVEDVHAALAHIGFDDVAFRKRDGNFFSS